MYSLGATLSAALENGALEGTSHVHQTLAAMVAREPSDRPSLQSVVSAAAQHMAEGGAAEVDTLVTLVLGSAHDVSGDTVNVFVSARPASGSEVKIIFCVCLDYRYPLAMRWT